MHVDDEPTNILLFEVNFKRTYRVISARSGFEAIELLKQNPDIDIVFCDMKMPGMNGLEFARQAAQVKHGLHCYILTGYDISPQVIEAINEGWITGYIQKPFDINQINDAINKALGRRS